MSRKPGPGQRRGSLQAADSADYSGIDELLAIEQYMPAYNRFIARLCAEYLSGCRSVVDFGAGIGTLSVLYRAETGVVPHCVEIDPQNIDTLRERGLAVYGAITEVPGEIDGVFSSNVLEHIEDDEAALRQIFATLKSGGRLVLYLPAFMVLFSELDRTVGHYRRYGRREIVEKLRAAGFQIDSCYYTESVGFFASLLVRLLGYDAGKGLASEGSLKTYDRLVLPLGRLFDRIGFSHLFGKNVVAIARKP